MTLTSRTSFLLFLASIGKINPAVYDAIFPHGPVISLGARDVMASMIIKGIASEIKEPKITQELHRLGESLFTTGATAMKYKEDDWCKQPVQRFGPDPLPWSPHPGVVMDFNPQPDPPGRQYYGALLILLADAVSVKEIGSSLRRVGAGLLDQPVHKDPVDERA